MVVMASYSALLVWISLLGAYFCLTMGRRSWISAILLLPAALLFCIVIVARHYPLMNEPLSDWVMLSIIISAPLPFISTLLALWIQLRRRKLIQRVITHRCVNCGYDLRASQIVCPECGRRI